MSLSRQLRLSSKSKDQSEKRPVLAAFATLGSVAALLALGSWLFIPRPIEVEWAPVEEKSFTEKIETSGLLRARERVIVPAFADGDMKRMPLRVGDGVKKGEIITELFWDVRYRPLRAPISGVVSRVFRESAGPIYRGESIVELINPDRLEGVAELLTPDAARVQIGDRAWLGGWGGETPLHAQVERVSQAASIKPSALGVEEEKTEVILNLDHLTKTTLARLGNNFHVDVTIEIAHHPKAWVIPSGALFRCEENWCVYRISEFRAQKVLVRPLARNTGEVMIESQLKTGDWVVAFPGDLIQDGTKVRRPKQKPSPARS